MIPANSNPASPGRAAPIVAETPILNPLNGRPYASPVDHLAVYGAGIPHAHVTDLSGNPSAVRHLNGRG